MTRPGVTQPQHVTALARRARVLQLRQLGLTYRQIAAALWQDPAWQGRLHKHYSARHAHADVMRALAQQREELHELAEQVRVLELHRLDQLQLALWSRAIGTPADLAYGRPAIPADIAASQQILRIMQQRMRLLPGLAAPVPVATTMNSRAAPSAAALSAMMSDVEIENVARDLAHYGQAQLDAQAARDEREDFA